MAEESGKLGLFQLMLLEFCAKQDAAISKHNWEKGSNWDTIQWAYETLACELKIPDSEVPALLDKLVKLGFAKWENPRVKQLCLDFIKEVKKQYLIPTPEGVKYGSTLNVREGFLKTRRDIQKEERQDFTRMRRILRKPKSDSKGDVK